jgi:hypothetical protein
VNDIVVNVRIARRSRGGSGVEIAWVGPGSRVGCPPCVVRGPGDRAAARSDTEGARSGERHVVCASSRTRERDSRTRSHAASHALQPAARRRPLGRDLPRCRDGEGSIARNPADRAPLRRCRSPLQRKPRRHERGDDRLVVAMSGSAPGVVPTRDPRLPGCRRVRQLHRRDQRRRGVRGAPARPQRRAHDGERRALSACARTRQPARVFRPEPCPRAV